MDFILWDEWSKAFYQLREAFSRQSTFLWAAIFCAGIAVRTNLRGVSSIVECLGLKSSCYGSLIRLCGSDGINLDKLLICWARLCLKIFTPVCVDGYMVLFGDGIKVAKEGKKMPAVKLMHQSSQSNKKAEFIMGHYLQALSLAVVNKSNEIEAVPLLARIHDGLVRSNRCKKTVINRFGEIISEVVIACNIPSIVVADAYYANATTISEVEKTGCHLVSRVAHNTVAHEPAQVPKKRGRGRPALKGNRVELWSIFQQNLDQKNGKFRYRCRDLYWSAAKRIVRFVIAEHESKGKIILMSSKLDLAPIIMLELYSKRWLIETGFKTAVHEIGTFSYHYWMKGMKPQGRKTKQYIHRESKEYRTQIEKKIKTYQTHVAFGCIVQGLMQHLAINFSKDVFNGFNGWLRTIRNDIKPSEIIVSQALRATLWNYLRAKKIAPAWVKFVTKRFDTNRIDMVA